MGYLIHQTKYAVNSLINMNIAINISINLVPLSLLKKSLERVRSPGTVVIQPQCSACV
jgi:hypothetical protein